MITCAQKFVIRQRNEAEGWREDGMGGGKGGQEKGREWNRREEGEGNSGKRTQWRCCSSSRGRRRESAGMREREPGGRGEISAGVAGLNQGLCEEDERRTSS